MTFIFKELSIQRQHLSHYWAVIIDKKNSTGGFARHGSGFRLGSCNIFWMLDRPIKAPTSLIEPGHRRIGGRYVVEELQDL